MASLINKRYFGLSLNSPTVLNRGIRLFASQSSDVARESDSDAPQQRAHRLLDAIPGNSYVTKTGTITLGTGALAFALSKELLIFNAESLVAGCFAGMVYFLYRNLSGTVSGELDARADQFRKLFSQSREAKRAALIEEMERVSQSKSVLSVNEEVIAMTNDISHLQTELRRRELVQRLSVQVKQKLDYIVQLEAQKRHMEQRRILEFLNRRVMQSLENSKLQDELVSKCLAELEVAVSKK